MLLSVNRFSTSDESTLGTLAIDGAFVCYTLEDTRRMKKIEGETRIPAGRYEIKLRDEGGLTAKYAERYGAMHKGMLWLQDVPDFQWVYIHTGNKRGHTEGCILVGDAVSNNAVSEGVVSGSRQAYTRIYPQIAACLTGPQERVWINIVDAG